MTKIVWGLDSPNYFSGVEGGVIHSPETGVIVPWNGLVSVDEKSVDPSVLTSSFDGTVYANLRFGGFYQCNIVAYGFPYEFWGALGIREVLPGAFITGQPSDRFNFSYKTLIGQSDYLIHFVYNALAIPTNVEYETIGETINVTRRKWLINATPLVFPYSRRTSHILIDSIKTDPSVLSEVENTLYGTDSTEPVFPSQTDILSMFIS